MGKLLDNLRKKYAAQQSPAKRHALNFLAHKNEIAEALKEGWTAKQIWEQMIEDGTTAMSYSSFCRHVRMTFTPHMGDGEIASASNAKPSPSVQARNKIPTEQSTTKSNPLVQLTEEERLDALKEEAFAAVRSRKPSGPLIDKPKSREEERRELFGK